MNTKLPGERKVVLARAIQVLLLEQARLAYPEECCGLLLGQKTPEEWMIHWMLPLPNNAPPDERTRQYEFEPLLFRDIELLSSKYSFTLLGIYHSHPQGTAIPSEKDIRMAWDDYLYCIIGWSPNANEMRFWEIKERSQVIELPVQILRQ